MVVVSRTRNGSFRLTELNGTVSKLKFAAFRIIAYHDHSSKSISVTCYDSFLFLRHSSLASLPYLRTVLRNALHLNTASFLHAVHGSLIPFPLAFYGLPSFTRVYLNAASSILLHRPSLSFISTLALVL